MDTSVSAAWGIVRRGIVWSSRLTAPTDNCGAWFDLGFAACVVWAAALTPMPGHDPGDRRYIYLCAARCVKWEVWILTGSRAWLALVAGLGLPWTHESHE